MCRLTDVLAVCFAVSALMGVSHAEALADEAGLDGAGQPCGTFHSGFRSEPMAPRRQPAKDSAGSAYGAHVLRRIFRPPPRPLAPRPYWYTSYFRPRRWTDTASICASTALCLGGTAALLAGDEELVSDLSDLGEVALDAMGYGVPVLRRDAGGLIQFGITYQVAMRTNSFLKGHTAVQRPNGEGLDSFPSAHTTSAFASATFLHSRYGPRLGVPAYIAAAFVGATRVHLDKHRLTDVVAGAGLGMISSWAVALPFGGECREATRFGWEPRWRIEFIYGAVLCAQHEVRVPPSSGTRFDFARQKPGRESHAVTQFELSYRFQPRHELALQLDPLDLTDGTEFVEPAVFDGIALGAGEEASTRWTVNRVLVRWRYGLLNGHRRLHLDAGLGVAVATFDARLATATQSARATHENWELWPHVHASYELLPGLRADVTAELGWAFQSTSLAGDFRATWEVTSRWDLGLGYRLFTNWLDADDLRSKYESHTLFVAIGRSF